MASISKARYWVGVLYPENMIDSWESDIGDLIELPFCYCIHDKDKDLQDDERKVHLHLIIAFPNTTTYKHALSVFNLLSKDGCSAINTCEAVVNIRSKYNYLIHDTETCKKKGKFLYPVSSRITGNNFDIGSYEQISITEKNNITKELCDLIMFHGFTNFGDFYLFVVSEFEDTNYFEVLKTYSGLFERLTKSNYQKSVKLNFVQND